MKLKEINLLNLPLLLMVVTTTSSGDLSRLQPPPPPGPPPPVVTHGSLGRSTVRHYIRLHLPAIRYCYVQELGRRPNLAQKVALRFTIQPTGHVTGCQAVGRSRLDRCVAQAVSQLRFPAVYNVVQGGRQVLGHNPTSVTYRFSFKPAKRNPTNSRGRTTVERLPRAQSKAPQRSGPVLPPTVTLPRALGVPLDRSAASKPAVQRPASRPAPRKPTIESAPSDDPLGGLNLSPPR